MSRSLLLIDMVLSTLDQLEAGKHVSARKMALTVGDDQARVLALMRSFAKQGLVRSREIHPKTRPNEKPYDVFTPVRGRVKAAILERTK